MTEQRTPFQHAVANPSVRKDIAAAVRDGIPVEQLAEAFNISESTVLRRGMARGTPKSAAAHRLGEVRDHRGLRPRCATAMGTHVLA
jgi:hypothetical protein